MLRWDIAQNMRCDIIAFTGINFSGNRTTMQIYPTGKKGDLESGNIGSIVVMAPVGTRVILISGASETDWESHPWRAVEIHKGVAYQGRNAHVLTVRIPDLENLDKVNVERTDPDFSESYPIASSVADGKGKGWTYGAVGPLKGKIQAIRIEKAE